MERKNIYLDHAATACPKAPGVSEAMRAYTDTLCANVGRGDYARAYDAAAIVLEARERLCALFHFDEPDCAVFTPGQTFSLNCVLSGFLRPGDHVLVSSLEHNAVMRPLNALTRMGVSFDRIPCGPEGETEPESLLPLLRHNTRLAVLTHASNVCGTRLPVGEIGALLSTRGIPLVLDAAQTAGHVPIDFQAFGLSALCIPGHKGLLGPAGVGALLMKRAFAAQVTPLVTGGTGSASDQEWQPDYMPDKFESGTLNLPGIFGLNAALRFLAETGVETLGAEETRLTKRFLRGVSAMRGVRVLGRRESFGRVGVVSLSFDALDNAEAAARLDAQFGIATRCGLHCAPAAHRTLGSFPAGSVRFSFGYGNTERDIDAALAALETLIGGR